MPRTYPGLLRPINWRRRVQWPLALAMLVPGACAHAASYLPGGSEAAPPTGDVALPEPTPAEPLASGGIRWQFAPWRYRGLLSLEAGWQRQGDGSRSQRAVAYGDIDFASYIWQPWFIQLNAGIGTVVSRDHTRADLASSSGNGSTSLTGRFAISVFPASRFPFELRADVSDSRTSNDTLGAGYRSQRVAISQGWRPMLGNSHVQLNLDFSRLTSVDGSVDTLTTLQATGVHQWTANSIELGAHLSRNVRNDTDEQSRLSTLSARHSYHPNQDLRVETLASANDIELRAAAGTAVASDIRQISTLVSWRPRQGQWLHDPEAPLQLTASARWVESGSSLDGLSSNGAASFNGTVGVTKELSRTWRVSAAGSLGHFQSASTNNVDTSSLAASASWTPEVKTLGAWQYAPTGSANLNLARSTQDGARHSAGLQLAHSLSRAMALGEGQSLSFNLSQSAATLFESGLDQVTNALAHGASVFWQSYGEAADQTFASLSVSDARTWSGGRGRFQIANLQLTRRTRLSRYASWSASVTVQASRSEAVEIDPFTGGLQVQGHGPGWQQFHSGTISYENQRAFGVPRLRMTLLLGTNSQQLERRALGDIDAPRERIGASLEGRLDYGIGRLEARLSARLARIEGNSVGVLFARLQRRF